MKYQYLSFDLWGTLITSNPQYRIERNNLLREIFGEVSDDEIKANKAKIDSLMITTGEQPSYSQIIAILSGTKLPYESFRVKMAEFDYENKTLVEKYPPSIIPEAKDVLQTCFLLGCDIYLLSNTSFIEGKSLRSIMKNYNILHMFKGIFFSNECMSCKPSGKFYHKVLSAVPFLSPILHIGDDPVTDIGMRKYIDSFIVTKTNPITNVLNLI